MNINLNCKKLGIKRLEMLEKIKTKEVRKKIWKSPQNKFDFKWADCWRSAVVIGVSDYEAEIGFYIDYLGFEVMAWWDGHIMLNAPDCNFAYIFYRDKKSKDKTNKFLKLEFMLGNIKKVSARLKKNKVKITQNLKKEWGSKGNTMKTFKFLSPNGIQITLWGFDKG